MFQKRNRNGPVKVRPVRLSTTDVCAPVKNPRRNSDPGNDTSQVKDVGGQVQRTYKELAVVAHGLHTDDGGQLHSLATKRTVYTHNIIMLIRNINNNITIRFNGKENARAALVHYEGFQKWLAFPVHFDRTNIVLKE
ncbi:uncharacterized protein LOC112694095 [Sipha flava]|uniref:Uncharacterized protein LOC112694095 n=1 Tax=Sipha flava TaxID=143950 RepID=A0A2S2R8A1_9HEMI|nr:uncharacterized protein LOC112694095 [Sipha flava]